MADTTVPTLKSACCVVCRAPVNPWPLLPDVFLICSVECFEKLSAQPKRPTACPVCSLLISCRGYRRLDGSTGYGYCSARCEWAAAERAASFINLGAGI